VRCVLRLQVVVLVSWAAVPVASAPESPVANAAMAGQREVVRALIAQNADVNAAQPDGMTALHWAARRGDAGMAATLIAAGARLEATTRLGAYTPLHVASREGHAEVVKALLDRGSNANAQTTSQTTPLHLAAGAGSAEAVRALLDRGANVNAREASWGQTPLIFAAANNRAAAIAVLIQRGADVNAATRSLDMPTEDAVDRAAQRRRQEVIDQFRAAAPADAQTTWRPTPSQVQAAVLAARAVQRTPSSVEAAAAEDEPAAAGGEGVAGYSAMVGTQGGLTALLHAARQGHQEAALALLDGGAAIDQTSGDHTSPLLIASMNGHFDLALRFVERGADANVASHAGATPLFAVLNLQWAPRARYPQPRAHDQQRTTYLDAMRALLEAGADPDARLRKHLWYTSYNHCCSENVEGATPFWRAAYATDVQAMRLLVSFGADPNIPTLAPVPRRPRRAPAGPDPSGLPPTPVGGPGVWPIHAASGVGYGEGYESNAHRHVPDGWIPALKYLVEELGADVNARDHNGYTALHHAASRGDNAAIGYLVSKGADVKVVSRRGQTVADMANGPYQRTTPYPETIALLERLGSKNNHKCVSC
jgi:uncharacterized protein